MITNEPDCDYWEDYWEKLKLPQEIKKQRIAEIHKFLFDYLPMCRNSLLEIGCAPGGWLSYFHNVFNYNVYGIELAQLAYSKTIENMTMLRIPATIYNENLFSFNSGTYNIIFSAGFIEHFSDRLGVIKKIVDLASENDGLVVTLIPGLHGINWWISKTFRHKLAASHFQVSKEDLIRFHESAGLNTVLCRYINSWQISPPLQRTRFSKKFTTFSFIINLPFKVWNKIIQASFETFNFFPQSKFVNNGVLYIGRRRKPIIS